MVVSYFLACMAAKSDSAGEASVERPVEQPSDEPATEPDLPDDVDSDGFTVAEGDCDDWDPAVYPGATEVWNGADDDCNGWVDQDGRHEGAATLNSVGVYQGQAYSFVDSCLGHVERLDGFASVELVCAIDTTQPQSLLLLGEQVHISAEATVFGDELWQGTGVIAGVGGDVDWDTSIELRLQWSALETDGGSGIQIDGALDTFYLDGALSGFLTRTE